MVLNAPLFSGVQSDGIIIIRASGEQKKKLNDTDWLAGELGILRGFPFLELG